MTRARDVSTPTALVLISSTTIGTAVSSVTVTNAFSATYDAYKIVISGGAASASDENIKFQLGASVTGYYASTTGTTFSSGAANVGAQNNTAFLNFGNTLSSNGLVGNMDFVNPFLAKYTYFNGMRTYSSLANLIAGYHGVAISYTDFTITPTTGTLTGGTISVYGYKK